MMVLKERDTKDYDNSFELGTNFDMMECETSWSAAQRAILQGVIKNNALSLEGFMDGVYKKDK